MAEPPSKPIGARLYALGWCQGVLFRLSGIAWAGNRGANVSGVVLESTTIDDNSQLILVTHDCDLNAGDDKEPFVEALLCYTETDGGLLANWAKTSSRIFVIDSGTGLVADATKRVNIHKGLLLQSNPIPWPASQERKMWFTQWLARRYDRPAVPDILVTAFQRPVVEAFGKYVKKNPDATRLFNQAVRQVRVSWPETETEVYTLHLVTLVRDGKLSASELRAVDEVLDTIKGGVKSNRVVVDISDSIVSAADMTLATYEATWPLYLDSYSYSN